MSEPVVEMHIEEAPEESGGDDTTVVVVESSDNDDDGHATDIDHEGRITRLETRMDTAEQRLAEVGFTASMAEASADAAVEIAIDAAEETAAVEDAVEEAVEEAEESADDEDTAPKSKTHWFHRSMSEWKGA